LLRRPLVFIALRNAVSQAERSAFEVTVPATIRAQKINAKG